MRYATADQSVICEQMSHRTINGKKVKLFSRFTGGRFDGYYSVPARIAGHAVPYCTDTHTLVATDTAGLREAIHGGPIKVASGKYMAQRHSLLRDARIYRNAGEIDSLRLLQRIMADMRAGREL